MTGQPSMIILGCGGSAGVPMIGNRWGECDPQHPKNRRTRPSLFVRQGQTQIVVDTGPDFKEQANREGITRLDAVFFTHAHSDHVLGIEELRIFARIQKIRIPVFGMDPSLLEIERRFDYLFHERSPLYPASLTAHRWGADDFYTPQHQGDVHYTLFPQDHGDMTSLGFRFGSVGYSTDMVNLPAESINALRGIHTWIVDGNAIGHDTAMVHANLPRLVALNEQIGADRLWLTHLTIRHDYDLLCRTLPPFIRPAWDGMTLF